MQLSCIIGAHAGSGTDDTCKTSHSTGGHFGYNRTRELLTRRYYWKGMCEEIRDFISRCDRCQRKKLLKIQKARAQLRNVPVPKKIFGQIAIDLLQMSESQGFMYVLGVQCFFTKWMEMVPIPNKKATTIAKQLYIIFTRYGCPDVIVSDRGTEFCNQLNEALFYYFGIEHRVTAPYHPEANGSSISHIYFPDIFFHFFNSTISISYS